MGIGSQQIMIILLVAVLIFGASRLPQIGEGMGKAIRNFKKGVKEVDSQVEDITPAKLNKPDESSKKD
jgi:sec-independent protein translocase protein TatA